MKKMRSCVFLILLAIVPFAYPEATGIVEGRVVNLTDPSIVARLIDLEVIELGGGMSIIKSAKTDASGRFRIEGLPQERRLIVRADYKGANYHAALTFSGGRAAAEIGVYEPTSSMKDIEVEGMQMAFQVTGDRIKTLETITFNNKTNPPRTFTRPEGSFRISKAAGLIEPPKIRVTAPGSTMPVIQPALESADGKSYYTLYPLRPGVTKIEVQELLPYADKSYSYAKTFYYDIPVLDLGVIPQDVAVSGNGLSRLEINSERNFAVYRSAPVKAGAEVVWEFSGGTEVAEAADSQESGSQVITIPTAVGRDAPFIGSLLLLGLIAVLWYAFNRSPAASRDAASGEIRKLREERERLLNSMAELEHRYETRLIGPQDFQQKREESRRRLRRISALLKKQ